MGVFASDGDGRQNRFGIAGTGNYVDRILFATKPLEAFKPEAKRDLSTTEGLFVGLAFDRVVQDDPQAFGDDVNQFGGAVRYLAPKPRTAPRFLRERLPLSPLASRSLRRERRGRARLREDPRAPRERFVSAPDASMNFGTTKEVTEAYQKITNDPVVDQTVLQGGARG